MPEKKIKKGAPKWTTTFADLSTLLLTFFVLMLSFANIDVEKFRDLLGSVQNAFGVQVEERGEFQAVKQEIVNKDSLTVVQQRDALKKQEMEEVAKQIKEVIENNELIEQSEIHVGTNSVRIRITGSIMFNAGQAEILSQAQPFLDGIVEAMNSFDYYLLIEGHTDSRPISTAAFPSNWELSGARASAVVRYLINNGIDNSRLSGIGHAYNYPIATNETNEGRSENRRVEFVFRRVPFRSELE